MFYFFIVFCLFHFVTTAGTIRQLRHDVGDLTRELALLTAREPEMTSPTADPVRGA
jgi:hypothetical protein